MINTENKFVVGGKDNRIVIMMPVHDLSKGDALLLAAWLVAMADDNDEFPGAKYLTAKEKR